MGRCLDYQDMPQAIQNLVDGTEFLKCVERIGNNYRFRFEDSFEVWYRTYDKKGKLITESPILQKERYS